MFCSGSVRSESDLSVRAKRSLAREGWIKEKNACPEFERVFRVLQGGEGFLLGKKTSLHMWVGGFFFGGPPNHFPYDSSWLVHPKKTSRLCATFRKYILTWNPKHPFTNGWFNWMMVPKSLHGKWLEITTISILHPFLTDDCLGFQEKNPLFTQDQPPQKVGHEPGWDFFFCYHHH